MRDGGRATDAGPLRQFTDADTDRQRIVDADRAPLRLIHVTTVAPSLRFLRGQPRFFADRGVEMEAITSPGPKVEMMSDELGIPIHTVEMPRRITPFRDLGALAKMTSLIRSLDPDVVHAHTPKGGLLGMMAATAVGVDTRIYHMRGLPMDTATGVKRALLKTTETVSCRLAHQVVAVGHSIRRTAVDEGVCSPDGICVLADGSGQGVDAVTRFNPGRFDDDHRRRIRDELGIPADATVVGFVGRLVADKGVVELADAWQLLRHRHFDAQLLVVGEFERRDPVPERTRRALQTSPRIHLAGFREDVDRLYPAMDLVALPTHREGFPNVPLEAAAMELPVVASDIGPCQEAVVDGETGRCFPVGDADALAEALDDYIADARLRHHHGQNGRQRMLTRFLPRRIWEDLARVYGEAVTTSFDESPASGRTQTPSSSQRR